MSALFEGLFDDAAIFPPGNAALPDAVVAHRVWRGSSCAALVGPFVCSSVRLDDLAVLAPGVPVSVTVPEGPGGLFAVVRREDVRVCSVEVPYDEVGWDALLVARESAIVYVEVPFAALDDSLAARLVAAGLGLKLRTGGLAADLFPSSSELARAVVTAVHAGLSFKLTAGLHYAVRHRDPETGFEHHGFANVLAATAAAERGAPPDEVAGILEITRPGTAADLLRVLSESDAAAVRHRFHSFGTCSIQDPIDDLTALGLLPRTVGAGGRP